LGKFVRAVWDCLLEDSDLSPVVKVMPCGCLVMGDIASDRPYLDLFVHDSGWAGERCDEDECHRLVWQTNHQARIVDGFDDPLSNDQWAALAVAVRSYPADGRLLAEFWKSCS
jgi:hypothetical protein